MEIKIKGEKKQEKIIELSLERIGNKVWLKGNHNWILAEIYEYNGELILNTDFEGTKKEFNIKVLTD